MSEWMNIRWIVTILQAQALLVVRDFTCCVHYLIVSKCISSEAELQSFKGCLRLEWRNNNSDTLKLEDLAWVLSYCGESKAEELALYGGWEDT